MLWLGDIEIRGGETNPIKGGSEEINQGKVIWRITDVRRNQQEHDL